MSEIPTGNTIKCRGVRGATVASENTAEAINTVVKELLQVIIKANGIDIDDVASIIFTATQDLTAAFPATAARHVGLLDTPLICMQEIPVPGAPTACVRLLLHWNTPKPAQAIEHIYMREAAKLRPEHAWPRTAT